MTDVSLRSILGEPPKQLFAPPGIREALNPDSSFGAPLADRQATYPPVQGLADRQYEEPEAPGFTGLADRQPVPPRQQGLADRQPSIRDALGMPTASDILTANGDKDPVKLAQAWKLASATGLSPRAAELVPEVQAQVDKRDTNAIIDRTPEIRRYIEQNPTMAQISHGDWGVMEEFARAAGAAPERLGDEPPVVAEDDKAQEQSWTRPEDRSWFRLGYEQADYGREAMKLQAARLAGGQGDDSLLLEYERQYRPQAESWTIGWLASMAGAVSSSLVHGAPIGATVGLIGGPKGALVGAGYGFSADFAATLSGQVYRQLDLHEGAGGEKLSETTKQLTAVTAGLIGAVMAEVGGAAVTNAVVKSIAPFMARSFSEGAAELTITKAAKGLAIAGVTGGVGNAGLVLATEGLPEVAIALAGDGSETIFNNSAKLADFGKHIAHAFAEGLVLFSALHTLPMGASIIADRSRVASIRADMAAMDKRVEIATRMETLKRSEEAFVKYIQFVHDDTRLPVEKLRELRQTDPTAFGFVKDLDQQLASGATEITIPLRDYYTHVTPELHALVREDLIGRSGLSLKDAAAKEEVLKQAELKERADNEQAIKDLQAQEGQIKAPMDVDNLINARRDGVQPVWFQGLSDTLATLKSKFDMHEDSIHFWTAETTRADGKGTYGYHQPYHVADGTLRSHIVIGQHLSRDKAAAVLLHEFGHALDQELVGKASPQLKAELYAAYKKSRDKSEDVKTVEQLRPLLSEGAKRVTSDWDFSYILHRSEWFADQVTHWLSTSAKPLTLVEKFFAGIGERWRQIYAAVVGHVPATKEVVDFLHSRWNDAAPEAVDRLTSIRRLQERGAELDATIAQRQAHEQLAAGEALAPAAAKALDDLHTVEQSSPLGAAMAQAIGPTIAKVKKTLWLDPIITPEAAGLSKADFAKYSKHIQQQQLEITRAIYRAAEKEIRRRESRAWKTEMADKFDGELKKYDALPEVQLERDLRDAQRDIKLKAEDVDALFPSERLVEFEALPSDMLHPSLVSKNGKGNFSLESMAEGYGFESAQSMIERLVEMQTERRNTGETFATQRTRRAKNAAEQAMETEHGNLEETIMKESIEAALSAQQLQVLSDQVQMLADKVGGGQKVTREMIEAKGFETFYAMPVKDAMKGWNLRDKVARLGAKAERAMLDGDFATAFQMKQDQAIALVVAKAAARAETVFRETRRDLKTISENLTIKSWEQEYLDAGHLYLSELGVKVPRSRENIRDNLADGTFSDFVQRKWSDEQVEIVPILPGIPQGLKGFTIEHLYALNQTLASLRHAAMDAKRVEIAGKKVEFDTVKDGMMKNFEAMPTKYDKNADPKLTDLIKGPGRFVDSFLTRMEQQMLWFDKGDSSGPFSQAIFRQLKEAQHRRDEILKDISKDFRQISSDSAWQKSLKQKIENTYRFQDLDGSPLRITRETLLGMILNMGSVKNFKNLTEGRGWDADLVRAFVDQHATKADFEHAKQVWAMLDKLWPLVAEGGRKNLGVVPERAQNLTIQTKFGVYDGGYYPLFRDRSDPAQWRKTDIFDKGFQSPWVADASMLRSRTGALYPVDLSMNQLPAHLTEMVQALTHTQAVKDAAKFLRDPDILREIRRTFGPEYSELMTPWLRDVANNGGIPDVSKGWATFNKLSATARERAMNLLISFRPDTAIIHGSAALFNSLGETRGRMAKASWDMLTARPEDILQETDRMFRNPQNLTSIRQWALAESAELRNRGHNTDRDVRAALESGMFGQTSWAKINMAWGTKLLSELDLASAIPVWVAEYKANRAKGLDHADAVYAADVNVRQAHGSSSIMDQPQVQRGPEVAKWFTMFYGYFSHNYNRVRNIGRDLAEIPNLLHDGKVGEAAKVLTNSGMQSFFYLIAPAMVHEMVRPHASEDQGWGAWAAEAVGTQMGSGIPHFRDMVSAIKSGQALQAAGPASELGKAAIAPFKDFMTLFNDSKTVSPHWIQHALELPVILFGWPGSRYTAKLGEEAVKRLQGEDPGDDYARLLLSGTSANRKHH